jgi:hypothetical protein
MYTSKRDQRHHRNAMFPLIQVNPGRHEVSLVNCNTSSRHTQILKEEVTFAAIKTLETVARKAACAKKYSWGN